MRDIKDIMKGVHKVAHVYTNKHFVYTSDLHGDGYVDYRPLKLGHEGLLREVCVHLFMQAIDVAELDINKSIVVIGPETMGALMVEQIWRASFDELPYQISTRRLLKHPSKEKEFIWEADPVSILDEDAQVIFIDDLLNATSTFHTAKKMLKEYDAKVAALCVIGDRSGATANQLGVRAIISLERFTLTRFDTVPCPLCHAEQPIVRRPGHGWKFEEEAPAYPGGFIDL